MRTILRYEDGRPVWSENVPASPGFIAIRGQLVTGESGPNDRQRQRDYQRKHLAKMREQAQG